MKKENLPELDPYCEKILALFLFEIPPTKEFGFNELSRQAEKLFKISKPTLANHLRHLIELGIIKKRVDETSNRNLKPTYYSLNYQFITKNIPKELVERTNEKLKKLEELPPIEILEMLFEILTVGDLIVSKLALEESLANDPQVTAEFLVTRKFLIWIQTLLLRRIKEKLSGKDKKEISKFFSEFDKQIEEFLKEMESVQNP